MLVGGCASTSPPPTSSVPVTTKPASKGAASPNVAAGNEQVRALVELDSLRREVALLRDQVEVQENELDKLRKRQRELYDDLDYRLRARERFSGPRGPVAGGEYPAQSGAPGAVRRTGPSLGAQTAMTPPASPGSAPGGEAEAAARMMERPGQPPLASAPGADTTMSPLPSLPVEVPASQSDPAPAEPPQSPTQVAVATAAEQAAYDSAFEMLKQGRYGEAIAAFENMVAQYPNGALADDSQYWVGEAWYVTRDYQRALGVFKQVVSRYPDSPRVPEALLKIGYVQQEVGAKAEACRTFTDVINRYPGSRVAISAQTKRKRLELDGHCS